MLEHTLKRGQYEWSLRRWWSRPMSEVYKINLCIQSSGLRAWPQENFKSSEIIFQAIYCIFGDETEQLVAVSKRDTTMTALLVCDCSIRVFRLDIGQANFNQDPFTQGDSLQGLL